MKYIIITIGVVLLLSLISSKFWNNLSHKVFSSFVIMIVAMNGVTFIPYMIFTVISVYFVDTTAFLFSIGSLAITLVAFYFMAKKLKSPVMIEKKNMFLKQLLSCVFFVSFATFTAILDFENRELESLSKLKAPAIILAGLLLGLVYIGWSYVCLYSKIKAVMNDDVFTTRLKEQEKNKYFLVYKEELDEDFIYQLDLGLYKTLNKKTILNMKHGEKESFTISSEALHILNELNTTQKEEV